jgi:hypothetical protein
MSYDERDMRSIMTPKRKGMVLSPEGQSGICRPQRRNSSRGDR